MPGRSKSAPKRKSSKHYAGHVAPLVPMAMGLTVGAGMIGGTLYNIRKLKKVQREAASIKTITNEIANGHSGNAAVGLMIRAELKLKTSQKTLLELYMSIKNSSFPANTKKIMYRGVAAIAMNTPKDSNDLLVPTGFELIPRPHSL